jgi:stage V sporulation protein B
MADASVTAGRGVIYIALAKLYFMIAGYAIYFTLPKLFDSEILWGNYLLVVGLVSVIDNVIVTGTIQGVSKFTAQDETRADGVKRSALLVQLMVGGGLAVAYVFLAPLIAAWERDEALVPFYRLSAGIMFCYSFYAVFVGSLNGLRRFGRQASLDVGFATLRAALILGFVAAGYGVMGAVGGFVSAAAMILIISSLWVGLPFKVKHAFPASRILSFILQIFLYTFCLNMIMRVDLFLLKRLVGTLSTHATAQAQADVASAYSGFYGTAQSLAFIPYQAILAVAFVIFPLISRSTFEDDLSTTQAYIKQTLRLSMIFAAGVAVVFMANPEAVINVPFQEKYRIGGAALRILAGGMVCFSMFTIINTILNSAGHTVKTNIAGFITLAVAALTNNYVIQGAGTATNALQVAAWASAGAMALGMLISTVLLYQQFKAAFPLLSVLRTLLAMGVALGVGYLIPEVSKLVTLAECVLVFVVYFVALIVMREFRSEDLAKFKRVLTRSKS